MGTDRVRKEEAGGTARHGGPRTLEEADPARQGAGQHAGRHELGGAGRWSPQPPPARRQPARETGPSAPRASVSRGRLSPRSALGSGRRSSPPVRRSSRIRARAQDSSMSSILVINAAGRETRVALVEGGHIAEFYLERKKDKGVVGNIYKGRVVRVLPGMQAAFVDIGLEKAAFLYVSDVVYDPDFARAQFELTEGEHEDAPDVPEESEAMAAEAAHGGRRRGARPRSTSTPAPGELARRAPPPEPPRPRVALPARPRRRGGDARRSRPRGRRARRARARSAPRRAAEPRGPGEPRPGRASPRSSPWSAAARRRRPTQPARRCPPPRARWPWRSARVGRRSAERAGRRGPRPARPRPRPAPAARDGRRRAPRPPREPRGRPRGPRGRREQKDREREEREKDKARKQRDEQQRKRDEEKSKPRKTRARSRTC